jgi:hypothetical protein
VIAGTLWANQRGIGTPISVRHIAVPIAAELGGAGLHNAKIFKQPIGGPLHRVVSRVVSVESEIDVDARAGAA